MNEGAFFQVANPDIVSDTIDDAIVIVNLGSGDHFTLDGVAREIWELLASGRSRAEIIAVLTHRYEGRPEQILEGVDSLIMRLTEEGLIVAAEEGKPPESFGTIEPTEKKLFESPVLVKYTDMEDLLNLDPIHEVDDSGWPRIKSPESP